MKIAGRKNDGAWFRANKAITKLTSAEKINLGDKIEASSFIAAAFADLQSFQSETGVNITGSPSTVHAWVVSMLTHGIPRQVWNGRLTWTTYAPGTADPTTGVVPLVANYQSSQHYFGKDLREIVTKYFVARRQMRDLFNLGTAAEGNPGGYPDASLLE